MRCHNYKNPSDLTLACVGAQNGIGDVPKPVRPSFD